ncbi:MAG: biotin--[acetyl-CoA-carboxylase] ligase [Rhizobiales bacterium]|nr:biotin--[acetyl-CoA-carboxylase] ligase [Hyphomicrobiales bacterium]
MKLPEGHRLVRFDEIDSTNSEAARRASAGERGPLWIIAGEQMAGRGRLGRNWVSESGNLFATLLRTYSCPPTALTQLGFVASLAMHDALAAAAPGSEIELKWPNDLLSGGAKICGILSEAVGQNPLSAAIGWGLNVAHAPSSTPYPVTSLAALGHRIAVESVFEQLASCACKRLKIWDDGRGFSVIRRDWAERSAGFGGVVRVEQGARVLEGIAKGIGDDGALLFETTSGRTVAVTSGDVRFLALDAMRSGS